VPGCTLVWFKLPIGTYKQTTRLTQVCHRVILKINDDDDDDDDDDDRAEKNYFFEKNVFSFLGF